jgi:hypothetical protein
MASDNDQTIPEIFADNDSENEDEFEGLGPGDIYIDLNNENSRTDLFDSEKWGVGNRQDQVPLTFSTDPGKIGPSLNSRLFPGLSRGMKSSLFAR